MLVLFYDPQWIIHILLYVEIMWLLMNMWIIGIDVDILSLSGFIIILFDLNNRIIIKWWENRILGGKLNLLLVWVQ